MYPVRSSPAESVTGSGNLAVSGRPPDNGLTALTIEDWSPRGFWAVITSHATGNAYGFARLDDGDPTTFPELDGAPEVGDGTLLAAYEVTGRTDVPTDGTAKVWLRPLRSAPGLAFEYRDGSGGSGLDCNGDGWLVAALPDDYWTIQEVGGTAPAVEIHQGITINGVAYTITFDPAVPSLKLNSGLPSAVDIVGRKDCSVCPCVTFAFRRKVFYPDFVDDPDDVCSRVLYVKVCASCPAGWYCTRPKNSDPGTPYTPLELEVGEACSGELDVQSGGPWESEEEAEEHCSACPPNMGLPCCTSWALPSDMKAGDVAWHVYDRIASSSPPSVTNCLTINGTGIVNVWYGPSKGCTGMTQFVFNSPRTCISIPPFDFLVNRIIYIEFTATVDGPLTGEPSWFTGICNCFNEEQLCPEDIP